MTLREHISIRATPEVVWPLVADPVEAAAWNPRIVAVDRAHCGPMRTGERFKELFRMSGRETEAEVEAFEVQEPSYLAVRYRPVTWASDRHVEERFRLAAKGETRLTHEVDFSHSTIPWLVQVVMWIIHKTGRSAEKSFLESLKQIAEHTSTPR